MEALSKFIQTILKDLLTMLYWEEEIRFKLEIITSYPFIMYNERSHIKWENPSQSLY